MREGRAVLPARVVQEQALEWQALRHVDLEGEGADNVEHVLRQLDEGVAAGGVVLVPGPHDHHQARGLEKGAHVGRAPGKLAPTRVRVRAVEHLVRGDGRDVPGSLAQALQRPARAKEGRFPR